MKGNPADIRGLAEDLDLCRSNHKDALHHNPDLDADLMKLAREAHARWAQVVEVPHGFDKNGDLKP